MASEPPPSGAAAENTETAQHTTAKTKERTYPLISRREIEALISEGRHIIIVDQYVLKVDPWVKYHPGGDKAIKHMIGRDATDEVNGCVQQHDVMYHLRQSGWISSGVSHWKIGGEGITDSLTIDSIPQKQELR